MSLTFEVDRVERATERARECGVGEAFVEISGRRTLRAWSGPSVGLLDGVRHHPFAAAVHRAFAEHRPLVLSPDGVWLTIAQGFAKHVNADPKAVRDRLVDFEGTRTVRSPVFSLESREDWAQAIDRLCQLVRQESPTLGELMRNDFSTSTPTTRVAGDIVLLDSLKSYFRYQLMFICGIPEVTLLGTPNDWLKIEQRVERLADYDLEWWTEGLLPVCRELRRSAEGDPDGDFWQCIYMPEEIYGGQEVTGWLMRFFPYIDVIHPDDRSREVDFGERTVSLIPARNPALEPWTERSQFGLTREPRPAPSEERRQWLCAGAELDCLPAAFSSAPVEILDPLGSSLGDVQIFAGFVGVSQSDSLALQAEIGWGVVNGREPLVRTLGRH